MSKPNVTVYDQARKNGLSHEEALEAVSRGRFVCWCGREGGDACFGGARRLIGCPVIFRARAVSGGAGEPA